MISTSLSFVRTDRPFSFTNEYSDIPHQVYINGEFVGGADIVMQMAQDGSLKEALEVAALE